MTRQCRSTATAYLELLEASMYELMAIGAGLALLFVAWHIAHKDH